MRRAIEEGFPIVEINRLAVPERNAFKPIYQMHKWFARRASCVFRAILLGCLKPGGTDIMVEFYKDHSNDPDTVGKVVLDPFMGGGTTVVEALRLGCRVIGVDVNPVAWFIVKTEVESVDLDTLRVAFDRLGARTVQWSGKSVRETLLDQYKTTCPCCGSGDADIIYTFWGKSALCTNSAPPCERKSLVPLLSDYVIAQKAVSIRYWRDALCPKCSKTFDWEIEPATLVAEPDLMITSSTYSAGIGRTTARWAYSPSTTVKCPWCSIEVAPRPAKAKKERKKVPLSVLLCPLCESVWQWRGELPEEVSCPVCHRDYRPSASNVPDSGKFICPTCGTNDAIIRSIRQLPDDQLLPIHPYAIQAYCSKCGGEQLEQEEDGEAQPELLGAAETQSASPGALHDHLCLLTKSSGKFFAGVRPADLARYQAACLAFERQKHQLPYPQSEIPDGQETHRLLEHHYRFWHQMFNPRQLLCLSTLLAAIADETNQVYKEMLLSAFFSTLEGSNQFARYKQDQTRSESAKGIFSRHDYQPKLTPCEDNVWGVRFGKGFSAWSTIVIAGKSWAREPSDNIYRDVSSRSGELKTTLVRVKDGSSAEAHRLVSRDVDLEPCFALLKAESSDDLEKLVKGHVDLIVTDPPYAGNVNYAELADFFYVWLRLVLSTEYSSFRPELTPKAEEIITNPARRKTDLDFEKGLVAVFSGCERLLNRGGLLAFTFHHSEGSAWVALLRAILDSGFEIHGIYPIHGEAESSLHLMEKEAISYDLVHVCKLRATDSISERRSWAGIRQEVRRRARDEIRAVEAGRYGRGLSPADVNIILIGKCLELYSRHYGAVVDHEGRLFELGDALKEIRNLVDQLVSQDQALPSELEEVDAESRIYLLALCDRKEIKSDDLHKATRGILEPKELIDAGLITKGRAGRGRTYEVKQPTERFQELSEKFRERRVPQGELFRDVQEAARRTYFVDYIHLLIALGEGGEPLAPWLERFRGETPRLRVACDYLSTRNRVFAPALRKVRDLLDVGPLFR